MGRSALDSWETSFASQALKRQRRGKGNEIEKDPRVEIVVDMLFLFLIILPAAVD